MTKNIIGPKIQKIRAEMQPPITQERLATELQVLGWDITRFGISKIERGERGISDKELVLLAKALSVSIEELIT